MKRLVSAIIVMGTLATAALAAQSARAPKVLVAYAGGSFMGVGIQEIDSERAKALKLKEEYGVEITRVDEDSPAEKAGLKPGDAVLHYNGQRVEGIEQFSRFVRETPPGREVKLDIVRDGKPQTVTVRVGARRLPKIYTGEGVVTVPRVEVPEIRIPDIPRSVMSWRSPLLGVDAESIEGQLADYFGVKDGVLIRAVIKNTPAAKAGLKAGDVIIKVDDTRVSTPSDVTSTVRSARGKKSIPVVVMRDRKEMTITVTLDDDRSEWERVRARTVKL